MKKIYFNFILLLALCFAAKAQQVPNGGFETWTNPKNPDGWYTYSSASNIIDLAHKDTADKVEGTASAQIQTTFLQGSTIYEILSLGTADFAFGGGTFSSIPWGAGSKFMEVALDPAGGTNYVSMGTTQIISVPYALQAQRTHISDTTLSIPFWAASGGSLYSTYNGNVGIGTTTPQYTLEVASTITPGLFKLTSTTPSTQITMDDAGADDVYLTTTQGQFDVWTGGQVKRISVTTTGNVGINNEAPASTLDVTGTGNFTGHVAMANGLDVNGSSTAYVINGNCTISNGNGVTGTASVGTSAYGVSGVSSTGYAGHFAGNLYYSGTLTGPSDERLKENIQPLQGALGRVMQLQPSTYNFKSEYGKMNLAKGKQIGFLAQNLEQQFPDLVVTAYDKDMEPGKLFQFKTVNYIGMIPVLTQAMQEQQNMIEELKKEIEELRKSK